MLKITGYSDRVSARPGETIKFMVNCELGQYRADIVKLICGDSSPDGPDFKEKLIRTPANKRYKGRKQKIYAGSYGIVESNPALEGLKSFTAQAMIWPTTPERGQQAILGKWNERSKSGFAMVIAEDGSLGLMLGNGKGKAQTVSTGKAMIARHWYMVAASWDAEKKEVRLYQEAMREYVGVKHSGTARKKIKLARVANNSAPLTIAALYEKNAGKRVVCNDFYNGKIDGPRISDRVLSRAEIEALKGNSIPRALATTVLAAWDFSRDISSVKISDISSRQMDGEIVNLPARGMTGANWSGAELCWRHAEDEYGAIHFHDDDLYDAGWDVDFELTIPKGLKSGIYAARLRAGDAEEYIPFAVRPERGKGARIAFILPTIHYMAYANEHLAFNGPIAEVLTGQVSVLHDTHVFLNEHREYGASLYDTHSDGSGVCYSSRLRPIMNMRPKYQTQWSCFGINDTNLREFNLDLYFIDWMERFGFDYDVVTDEDIHYEGTDAIEPHTVIITGGHPEYYSKQMRDAVFDFTQKGGRLMYMGGNGFYWRVALHQEVPGVIEVRRCEAAIKTWGAETGEYYHSFTGEHGGLWRHQGETEPQRLTGIGFTSEGFDISSYYRQTPEAKNPRVSFMFKGIGKDELIGDFGFHGGGAAGNELDRADPALGTPPHALVVATSEDHTDLYMVVNEEILVNFPGGTSGPNNPLVRADMVFFETPNGGAVFSTGSIAYGASLPWNDYDNNVAKLTTNVLKRFADPKPF
ncbi:MAG: LamG domain-containing protein [Rhodospirillaceae bacterium]|nr:LamG domain-containing protein [Rhodospirillaceae bacterium]